MKLIARKGELQKARKNKKLTQSDMADLLTAYYEREVTEATYNKWESSGRKIDMLVAKSIADILDKPIHILFKSAERGIKFGADAF